MPFLRVLHMLAIYVYVNIEIIRTSPYAGNMKILLNYFQKLVNNLMKFSKEKGVLEVHKNGY